MLIKVLKSKIERVKVTQSELHNVGNITMDKDMIDTVNLVENAKVQIVNINNRERLETYLIKGERGSGMIYMNGADARKTEVGDIIITYGQLDFDRAKCNTPTIIFPNTVNKLP